jgi:hypothetical protein
MSFLAPLFLIGGAVIAAPIIFHLIRRTSREKIPFSSLMFLTPTPPRITRKSRLENILLLVMRCGVIALLALAFARPFLRQRTVPEVSASKRTVVLIDASASMKRDALWTEAKRRAVEIVRKAGAGDEISIALFDRGNRVLVSFAEWAAAAPAQRAGLVRERFDAQQPGWGLAHLGNALISASDLLDADAGRELRGELIVLTDAAQGTRLDGLQGFAWPRNVTVTAIPLKTTKLNNAGVQILPESIASGPSTELVRARVSNSAESTREQFALRWSSGSTGIVTVYVPPGQSRTIEIPKPSKPDRLVLTGDEADFDNSAAYVPPQRQRISVLFVGDQAESDPKGLHFYLKRAFTETARELVTVTNARSRDSLSLSNVSFIVVGDVPAEESVRSIRTALEAGATAVVPMTTARHAEVVSALAGVTVTAEEAAVSRYAMFGEIDFSHPLFSPFSDARFSDFTKIHFWKHRKLRLEPSPHARIAAKFDSGDTAVAHFPVGKGALFVFAAGWHPDDGQLALSSKFVPLLYSMLEFSGAIKSRALAYNVGDGVELGAGISSVQKPGGASGQLSATGSFSDTDVPGIYTAGEIQFAVNVPPEESRTSPMPLEELLKLGVPLASTDTASTKPGREARKAALLRAAEMESRQKLWRWLIAATLVVLVVETFLAARSSRRAVVGVAT